VALSKPSDVLRAADRHKLERRAHRAEVARKQLREAAREANVHGASLREIAAVLGMSHTGVAKWLKRVD
jgi:hypothetical protein